jgi:spermidine synthase
MNSDWDKQGEYFWDRLSPNLTVLHALKRRLYSGRTKFQAVEIVDTASFGVCLVLDGKIQSSEADEFIYHEALVHPVMIVHPHPEKVFIAGGGEGATLREVLAHRTVKRAVMVDIDEEVVDLCRRLLPSWHRGSFDDPRTELYYSDARKYLEENKQKFDVIIIDLVDPLEGGPARLLYTREFYHLVKERLEPDGIISVQAECAEFTNLVSFAAIANTLKTVFPVTRPYTIHVPSFLGVWGFVAASQTLDPARLSPREVDDRILQRISGKLRCYAGSTHQAMFTLPRHIERELAATRRIITDQEPIAAY